ncbi:bifunctional riboflavin kinase/FAD synthetase [Melioribacteraceae bacterium 4301-Me]|uniref:bifunctional riboflavin kinase/FAD synthetase n=1 Tax=Pyranulibacter aquaticus TaxID=3163344 RepID=UPI00359B09C2
MKIYSDTVNINNNTIRYVVTVGTFDGLHIGHMKIIDSVVRKAQSVNGQSVLVTFEPHPRLVLSKDYNIKLLTTFDEKRKLLQEAGIDNLIVINFTKQFSQLSSEEFIYHYIVQKIGAQHMIIGYDHKFGKDRNGDVNKLKQLGEKWNFSVTSVPPAKINGEIISSTLIRNALNDGDIEKANLFLGRAYSFSGTVVEGVKRGRTLGFPTANIHLNNEMKLIPKRGVYFCSVKLMNENLYGLMNIGIRPTFENKKELVIEVHILNFNDDIYGQELEIDLIKRIRDEKKFESKEQLVNQIENDKKQALEYINVLIN